MADRFWKAQACLTYNFQKEGDQNGLQKKRKRCGLFAGRYFVKHFLGQQLRREIRYADKHPLQHHSYQKGGIFQAAHQRGKIGFF